MMAGAMRSLIADDRLRRDLVVGGREVAARFTWEAAAHRHLEIYESVMGMRQPPTLRASAGGSV